MTATVTAATRQKAEDADPFVETGISEACIGDIIALNCKTARESVDFLARVMEESGNAEPSVILVADQDEAWYIETYTGSEKQTDYANMRNWYGQFLFNKNDPGKYETGTKYELLFTPKEKMNVRDIQEMDRSRFEGTEFCPDENGRDDMRIIGIETQYSVFVPFSNLITKASPYWSRDVKEGFPYEDETIAFYAFQNLCVLSVTGRDTYGKGVRAYRRSVEDHLLKTYPEVLMKTAELYKTDKEAGGTFEPYEHEPFASGLADSIAERYAAEK